MKEIINEANNEYQRTIIALSNASLRADGRRNFREISLATNLSSSWLSFLIKGKIVDAGFKRMFLLRWWLIENGFLIKKPSMTIKSIEEKAA